MYHLDSWSDVYNVYIISTTVLLAVCYCNEDGAPRFQSTFSQPQSINATEGDTISFFCRTDAEPAATVKWYRDGVEVKAGALPPRYSLSRDGTELWISEVCRKCPDGSSDIQVIQCNATNQHGYASSAGYLNILKPHSVPCNDQHYCLNGGTCYVLESINRYYCVCANDFLGERCQEKLIRGSSLEFSQYSWKIIAILVVCAVIAIELIIIIFMCICYLINKNRKNRHAYERT